MAPKTDRRVQNDGGKKQRQRSLRRAPIKERPQLLHAIDMAILGARSAQQTVIAALGCLRASTGCRRACHTLFDHSLGAGFRCPGLLS